MIEGNGCVPKIFEWNTIDDNRQIKRIHGKNIVRIIQKRSNPDGLHYKQVFLNHVQNIIFWVFNILQPNEYQYLINYLFTRESSRLDAVFFIQMNSKNFTSFWILLDLYLLIFANNFLFRRQNFSTTRDGNLCNAH